MTTLHELRDKLREAKGSSRELDATMCEAFALFPSGTERVTQTEGVSTAWAGGSIWWEALPLTSSIDAALALVERLLEPDGFVLALSATTGDYFCNIGGGVRHSPTAPLAILRTMVEALIAIEEGHG